MSCPKKFNLEINNYCTIDILKFQIYMMYGIALGKQHIYINDRYMHDSTYCIRSNDIVRLVIIN